MWCLPPAQDAACVCAMEQVLEVYQRPYDPAHPVVCMDEHPKQLIAEPRTPLAAVPGQPARQDYEYIREGVCDIWMFVEPLAGYRRVEVTGPRTAVDWAEQARRLVDDPHYHMAEDITLVCDNLNTHTLASLYQAFPPEEAMRRARKLEIVHTPKHGSWLNVAASELRVLHRQCWDRHIADSATVSREARTWAAKRNASQVGVDGQFTTADARIKLKRLYPKVNE
jgi:DDE superfamily endonuclease